MTMRFCMLLALGAMAWVPAQQATFSSRTDIVRIDALVTHDRQPIPGLTRADFDVFDESVRQDIDFVAYEDMPLNVVMATDMSGSMTLDRLQHLRAAGSAVIDALRPGDRAALVSFATSVAAQPMLTSDVAGLRAALARVHPGINDTSLIDASYSALLLGDAESGRSLVMVFSDGGDTASFLTAAGVLKTARRIDAVVYGVTATSSPNRSTFLRDLSVETGGRLLNIDTTARLEETLLRIVEEFRHRYVIGFTPRGVARTGWHRLDVRVRGRSAQVDARPGYLRDR
jgi:VWFA-related protein